MWSPTVVMLAGLSLSPVSLVLYPILVPPGQEDGEAAGRTREGEAWA